VSEPAPESEERAEERIDTWLPPVARHANSALMLGILGFATCGLLSPLAIYFGHRALREIEASGGAYSGEAGARAGELMGIVGTTMLLLAMVLALLFGLRAWDFVSDLSNRALGAAPLN
jgi:hypothetical protein